MIKPKLKLRPNGFHSASKRHRFTLDGAGQTHKNTRDLDGAPNGFRLGDSAWLFALDVAKRRIATQNALEPSEQATYAYDAQGRIISAKLPGKMNALRYNTAGRVIQSQTPNGVTAYRYNGLGERISKRRLSGIGINNTNRETHYFYDPAGRLISESDATGKVTRTYLWLGDTPMAMMDSGSNLASNSSVNSANVSANGADKLYYLHTDPLNTPRLVTNDKNETVWRWNPIGEPFGAEYPEEGKTADGTRFTFNLRVPGQYYDAETGSYYNYYRDHYFPELGRYGQSDPIGLAGGLNTYAYVEGNPLMFVDPSGLRVSPDKFYIPHIADMREKSPQFKKYYDILNNSPKEYIIKKQNNKNCAHGELTRYFPFQYTIFISNDVENCYCVGVNGQPKKISIEQAIAHEILHPLTSELFGNRGTERTRKPTESDFIEIENKIMKELDSKTSLRNKNDIRLSRDPSKLR